MADFFDLKIRCAHEWDYKTVLDAGPVRDTNSIGFDKKLTTGNSLYQVSKNWHARRNLGPVTNDDFDLTNLSLAIFGGGFPVVFSGLKSILVNNLTTVDSDALRIGGYGAGGFSAPWGGVNTSYSDVYGLSPFQHACNTVNGWIVTNGVNDILRVRNISTTNTITYDISLVGI